jgi:D-aminoacyl-tRNA deacylase
MKTSYGWSKKLSICASVTTVKALMIVSQFTLYASTKKGNRPSFTASAKPDIAIPLYENFIAETQKIFPNKIATGVFGADMKITLLNDGPVTIIIDSKNKE